MHLHIKNQTNPNHEFREKCKLAVGNYGHFLKTVHWIRMKISNIFHLGIIHFLSKNHENPTYQLKDMPISISALLQMSMNKNVLQLNFLNQYFKKYKLSWAEIFQTSIYHYNVSPHQKLDNPTSRILKTMRIGCR